jgi:hypothetical protein
MNFLAFYEAYFAYLPFYYVGNLHDKPFLIRLYDFCEEKTYNYGSFFKELELCFAKFSYDGKILFTFIIGI